MSKVGNKTWYLIRNIVIALLYWCAASSSSFVTGESVQIVLYILGGLFVISALLSFKDMGLRVIPVALIGIGLIALADYLISNFEIMKTVTGYLSGGLLIVFAFFQYGKIHDGYGSGTKLAIIMKLLPYLYPTVLMVGVIFAMFPTILPDGRAAELAPILVGVGAVGWIVYTLLVIRILKGASSGGTKSSHKNNNKTSGGGKTVASVDDVRKAMESVANRLTGGIETLGSGTNIYFSTTVSVFEGEINFKVNGDVRGTSNIKTQSDLDTVTRRIESVVTARQKRVMELAKQKLDKLVTDVDYTINVNVGNMTQD